MMQLQWYEKVLLEQRLRDVNTVEEEEMNKNGANLIVTKQITVQG
jgi:hypothetical protein